jgi:hypothetical protein
MCYHDFDKIYALDIYYLFGRVHVQFFAIVDLHLIECFNVLSVISVLSWVAGPCSVLLAVRSHKMVTDQSNLHEF